MIFLVFLLGFVLIMKWIGGEEREREKKVEGINKFISAIFSRYMSAQKAKYGAYFLVLLNKIISCTFFNIIVGIVLMKTEQLYYRNITKPVNLTSASFQHMFRWNKSIFQGISSFSTNIQICQTSLKFFYFFDHESRLVVS